MKTRSHLRYHELLSLSLSRISGLRFRVSVLGFGFRISNFGPQVSGLGFRVSGFRFRVSGFGFRVSGFGFWVPGFRFRVPSSGFGFWVTGFGFQVPGFGIRVSVSEFRDPDSGIRISCFTGQCWSALFACGVGRSCTRQRQDWSRSPRNFRVECVQLQNLSRTLLLTCPLVNASGL